MGEDGTAVTAGEGPTGFMARAPGQGRRSPMDASLLLLLLAAVVQLISSYCPEGRLEGFHITCFHLKAPWMIPTHSLTHSPPTPARPPTGSLAYALPIHVLALCCPMSLCRHIPTYRSYASLMHAFGFHQ